MHRAQAGTLILRPHPSDWLAVRYGQQTEFRTVVGLPERVVTPSPVVLWRRRASQVESVLFLLEAAWREPLGAVSEESLARSACASLAEFRERWVAARRRYFDATKQVCVWRVRAWRDGDAEAMGGALLHRLYGPYLPS